MDRLDPLDLASADDWENLGQHPLPSRRDALVILCVLRGDLQDRVEDTLVVKVEP